MKDLKDLSGRSFRTSRLIVLVIVGFLVGTWVAAEWNPLPLRSRERLIPAPYRLSKIPGGTALRLAMVHDVLHERYLRHGPAWYVQRNADARKIISQQAPAPGAAPSAEYLDAMDDVAVGLEQTGQTAEALAVLEKKLLLVSPLPDPPASRPAFDPNKPVDREQIDRLDLNNIIAAKNLSPLQHHLYTTLANLGTILILDALPKLLAGSTGPATRLEMQQSLDDVERAIAINPGGHFGREVWQAILIEHLLAALDHPDLLVDYDMIGDVLAGGPEADDRTSRFLFISHRNFYYYARKFRGLSDPNMTSDSRLDIRANVTRLRIDTKWAAVVKSDYQVAMPFDEPTLAIIGMWTIGGGPNPHFALGLGRIMETIGQQQIAWNAYERAVEMKASFWPDPSICDKIVAFCRSRQEAIAQMEDAADPKGWEDKMRTQHASEMAWGLAYQKAYQDFEVSQIAAGVALDDPNFYTPFFSTHPSIASSPGLADDVMVKQLEADSLSDVLPCQALGIGIGMAITMILPKTWLKRIV